MKVVINVCFGGFSLSDKAVARMKELGIEDAETFWGRWDNSRADLRLVQTVEELGHEANGHYSKLRIVTIPDDVKWHIHEYDGLEHVAENHRTWDGDDED